MKSWTKQWTLVSIVMCGCQLGVEQLEVGDEADETDGSDAAEDMGDGDGEASLECVMQGTNLGGGDQPLDYPLPDCEVECATGWGHGAPPLAIDWTLDLEHDGPTTGWTHLRTLPDGDVLAFIGSQELPARLVWISPEGELLDELTTPEIDGDVWAVDVDAAGIIYAIWRDTKIWPPEDLQSLTAFSSAGEHLWTKALGPHKVSHSVLAARGSGVVVPLNPADGFEGATELLLVSATGDVTSMGPFPLITEVAVSPSGNTLALANSTTISWTNVGLFPTGTALQGVADVSMVFGLVALDDQRVATVGAANNWDENGLVHGYIKQIGHMGLGWEGRYDRATSWCPEQTATEEVFIDLARLPDGSLIVVGRESAGDPQQGQPLIVHVSAQGEVLATDRGFWRGEAVSATAGSDGAAYVLLYAFDGSQQQLHVRKYQP